MSVVTGEQVSAPELMKTILEGNSVVAEIAKGGVQVGTAEVEQMKLGCIVLGETGLGTPERYLPLLRPRLSVRCTAPSYDEAETLQRAVYQQVHGQGRRVVKQNSTDQLFLVHSTYVAGGPVSGPTESADGYWEDLLVVEMLIGTEEVSA